MFGLDDSIAAFSDGTTVLLVAVVALLLGLRHATDPDHLAAVTTLVSGKRASARRAGSLALAWGLGHATTLFAFGLPIVLYRAYLPDRVQQGAEATVGFVIVLLAAWLLLRWHRGVFHTHPEREAPRARSRFGAYGIGLVHGMGGSAGVGVLLLSTIESHSVAVIALAVFAVFTAVSMVVLSAGYGHALAHARVERSFGRVAPVLGTASLAFGVWYALGALSLAPYWF
jgi:high-affinity nickel permease